MLSATPEPAPAGSIVFGAEALEVRTDGSTVLYPYGKGAADAIASVSSLLGAPQSSVHVPVSKCQPDETTVTWSTMTLEYESVDPAAAAWFRVQTRTVSVQVGISSPNGARVGDAWASYAGSLAGHPNSTGDYQGKTYTGIVDSASLKAPTYGTIVDGVDGTITGITAQSDLHADC